MLDVSDWVWLAVVILWALVLPRFFRALAKRNAAKAPPPTAPPPAAAPSRPTSRSDEAERIGDVGPGPIEPR